MRSSLTDVLIAAIAGLVGLGVMILHLGMVKRGLMLRLRRVRVIEEQQRQFLDRLRRDHVALRDRLARLEVAMGGQGTLPGTQGPTPGLDQGRRDRGLGHSGVVRLEAGQVLGSRYHLEHKLGQGGMGVVYAAEDDQLGQRVALKILPSGDGTLAERLRNEATAMARINHCNVIRVHELHESDGLLYLAMEYFAGETLAEVLRYSGPLAVIAARGVLGQVAEGLAAAHAAGVLHRDLKPENVLIGADGHVKLIDFGLARASFLPSLTRTGSVMGTPEYMAPEQVQGGEVDERTDVYALGCLAYHLLAGQPPFQADTPFGVAFRQCSERPTRLRAVRPDLPRSLETAVMQALAKDKDRRFADVLSMRAALLKERPSSPPIRAAMPVIRDLLLPRRSRRQQCAPAAA